MRIVRYLLLAFAVLFLLPTMALPFGVNMAMHQWYLGDGAAQVEKLDRELESARQSMGGKLPPALEKGLAEGKETIGVARSMARWQLAMIPLALALIVAMFLPKRAIPLVTAGVVAVAAVLAMVTIPDIKGGFFSSREEMMVVCIPALIGTVFATLASLIHPKPKLA